MITYVLIKFKILDNNPALYFYSAAIETLIYAYVVNLVNVLRKY